MDRKYSISESEEVIMDILKEENPLPLQEIIRRAKEKHHWADSTIKTFVGRLVKKGALQKDGKRGYSPAYSEENRQKKVLKDVVDRFFEGSYRKALLCFCETEEITEEELKEIMQIIKKGE